MVGWGEGIVVHMGGKRMCVDFLILRSDRDEGDGSED